MGSSSRLLKFQRMVVLLILCTGILMLVVPVPGLDLVPGTSQSSVPVISNGDPVTIHGIATGQPQNGLMVWVIGYNYLKISNIQVNDDNTYSYEMKSADTANLASGQYLVIVQHPMMNGQFDITYDPATGNVINRQLGGGTAIFQLGNAGNLQSPDAATALMQAIGSQNVDDTFATASFSVSPPNTFIHPVGDHTVGEKFTITGSTNLAVGDNMQVDVYSSSFVPTGKNQDSAFSGASGVVQVMPGSEGLNTWSFVVDATNFKPDEYIVTVSGITQDVHGSATFNIVRSLPTTVPLPSLTFTTASVPTQSVTEPQVSSTVIPATTMTRKSPLFGQITATALAIALFAIRVRKDHV
jgi:trimeric autotransporter adhesin